MTSFVYNRSRDTAINPHREVSLVDQQLDGVKPVIVDLGEAEDVAELGRGVLLAHVKADGDTALIELDGQMFLSTWCYHNECL